VWDKFPEAATAFAAELGNELGLQIVTKVDAERAVNGVDIIVTATPGEGPVLQNGWVQPGQHITAIGADTAGKQELDTEILLRSALFVDNRQQALTLGESQHLGKKVEDPDARIRAELGEVILGRRLGRQHDDEITVFDATGVTFQDLVVAGEIFRRCQERDLGTLVSM
jgi:ornithine cyclodeaminase/alanine dehydrogenase-like protein (mu-crystallin family)